MGGIRPSCAAVRRESGGHSCRVPNTLCPLRLPGHCWIDHRASDGGRTSGENGHGEWTRAARCWFPQAARAPMRVSATGAANANAACAYGVTFHGVRNGVRPICGIASANATIKPLRQDTACGRQDLQQTDRGNRSVNHGRHCCVSIDIDIWVRNRCLDLLGRLVLPLLDLTVRVLALGRSRSGRGRGGRPFRVPRCVGPSAFARVSSARVGCRGSRVTGCGCRGLGSVSV